MAKRLLTKDFKSIVFETFNMPESDFHNYYLNVIEEYHAQNPSIVKGLIQVLNGWIGWYNSKVYSGKLITIRHKDGTTVTIDKNQTFEVDENGQRVKIDLRKTEIPLYPDLSIKKHVNRAFFENQIKILEAIQSGIDLKQKIEAIENQLPTVIKDTLAEYPQPTGFDLDELQSRVKLLSRVPYIVENLKTQVEELIKRQTDTPHQITKPVAERIFSTDQYKAFQQQIQQNGFYNVTINNQLVKVYTPELMVLFTSNDLTLQNAHTDEKTTINGRDYLETYAKRFNEGLQYFESNFTANVNTLYGANAEKYVNDIHFNYWNKQHERNVKGWHYFKTSYPLLISHKEIGKYGFYAGIISKVEELASKHPNLFETFENCEPKTEQPEPQETAKGKQSANSEFSVLEWATIFYYADETKLLTNESTIIGRIRKFIENNEIKTTPNHFKNNYNDAKKRINELNNYPISKLEKIQPYLKKHYKETITKIENDIFLLQNENSEY